MRTGIKKGAPQHLVVREGVNVGNVALFAPAEFDAESVDQHETVDPLDAADAHLQRDPSAKGRADQRHILEILPVEQVEIEVGEIVDGAEAIRPLGAAEAGMPRRR